MVSNDWEGGGWLAVMPAENTLPISDESEPLELLGVSFFFFFLLSFFFVSLAGVCELGNRAD